MRPFWLIAGLTVLATTFVLGQGAGYKPGNAISVVTTVPAVCNVGETVIVTTTVADVPMGTYFCTQTNVWQRTAYALLKNFTNLQNNVFVDTVTVSVPNVGLSSLLQIDVLGALGAGGAVGAFESSTGRTVYVVVTRVMNVGTDATIAVVANAVDAHAAGGAGIVIGTQLSAITGAATGTQTFTVQARVVRGGGTSNNHAISIRALVLRAFGAGVTIT